MPVTTCDACGSQIEWHWEEAFYKCGFDDGDGQIETWQVEAALSAAGYEVKVSEWGVHNTVIVSIKRQGIELIPYDSPNVTFGYDNPRNYLPPDIVIMLDTALP